MTEPPDPLEQRFRAALPETDGTGCPSAEDFWAAASGDLPFERLRSLVDHGAHCAQCAEAWRILADVRREAVAPAPEALPAPLQLRRRRPPMRALVPLGLSALIAAALVVSLRPSPPRPAPVERGNGGASLRAESQDVQPVRRAVLRWSEVPGARTYDVTVLTPDLVVVHQAKGLSIRELRLPDAVSERAAGTGLLWNVDAVMPDGRTVASPTFELRLRAGD
jgi:hypothetical protein